MNAQRFATRGYCLAFLLLMAGAGPSLAQPSSKPGPMQSGTHAGTTAGVGADSPGAASGSPSAPAEPSPTAAPAEPPPASATQPTIETTGGTPAADGQAAATPSFDAANLFATTCGWCHASGGRAAGKGPQLMHTTLTDGEIRNRIRTGRTGRMPAFGATFNDEQLGAIIAYIRKLQPIDQ